MHHVIKSKMEGLVRCDTYTIFRQPDSESWLYSKIVRNFGLNSHNVTVATVHIYKATGMEVWKLNSIICCHCHSDDLILHSLLHNLISVANVIPTRSDEDSSCIASQPFKRRGIQLTDGRLRADDAVIPAVMSSQLIANLSQSLSPFSSPLLTLSPSLPLSLVRHSSLKAVCVY